MWSGMVTQAVPIFNRTAQKAMEYGIVSEGKAEVVVKVAGANKSDPKFGDTAVHGKTFLRGWRPGPGRSRDLTSSTVSHKIKPMF